MIQSGEIKWAWVYLLLAGIFEIAWAISLKYSQGLTRLWPSVCTIVTGLLSFWLLAEAVETLPIGTAYAVWTGIGAVGTAVLGMILFGDSRDWPRLLCLLLIVSGIVGLRLFSSH